MVYYKCFYFLHLATFGFFFSFSFSLILFPAINLLALKMGVFLKEFGGTSANFKVMPRFKIRGEGDPVRAGDQCVLLSEKASGQYLTCTAGEGSKASSDKGIFRPGKLISNEHVFQQGDAEASASAEKRGWTIKELFRAAPPGPHKKRKVFIQSGDVVQLQHKEMEKLLGSTPDGIAAILENSRTDVRSLWQVCHHGPYNDHEESSTQSRTAVAAKILNNSNRLEGGKIKKEKLLKKVGTQSISFRNVLTGQYLMRYSDPKDNGRPDTDGRERGRSKATGGDRARASWKQVAWKKAIKQVIASNKLIRQVQSSSPQQDEVYLDIHDLVEKERSGDYDDSAQVIYTTEMMQRFRKQLKLCDDSKGSGLDDMDKTAFGLVPVDTTKSEFIENNGYYRIRDKKNKRGAFVHFPDKGQQVPELIEGSDSFQDVFCITKVHDSFLRDIYYVQGLQPVLQQLVNMIDSSGEDGFGLSAMKEDPGGLIKLLKLTRSDQKSNILQVGVNLCKEITLFLAPLDSTGAVDATVAADRRLILEKFNVLESLVRVLHVPLVGQTGPQLREAALHLQKIEFQGQSVRMQLSSENLRTCIGCTVASLSSSSPPPPSVPF